MDNLLPLTVTHNGGSSFTIEWDDKDIVTSLLNDWTVEDFQEAIRVGCAELLVEDAERLRGK
jgi:hypothetical protein